MRLFVALTPPADRVEELWTATASLRAASPRLRWTRPEQWHLTLAFLGEVDDRARADLAERLARAARRHPPPELHLGGGGRFGDRVLWTRVHGDVAGLARLAASVRAAARRARLPVEERSHRPHLTLARAGREPVALRPAVAALASFTGRPWTACTLELVRSRLGAGPDGSPAYDTVGSWTLGGRA
ncbi:MAG TPA: RNA 2',3'-cyclic phosphodiesterase [Pseudonocardia sp.]|nr:RNA 2',3'-cyclic phosphodiesterase [Pseudonocardia sp.]